MNDQDAQLRFDEWARQAREDSETAQLIVDEQGWPSKACFHAQQAAEKWLKGLIAYRGMEVPKEHDLLKLAYLIAPPLAVLRVHLADLEQLRSYYIQTRYPGDYPTFSLEIARQALVAMERIERLVRDQIHG